MNFRLACLLSVAQTTAAILYLSSFAYAQTEHSRSRKWLACDVIWAISDPDSVGSNFVVSMKFHDTPVSAVKVVLKQEVSNASSPDEVEVATRETNSDGVAEFFGILPGTYTVGPKNGLLAPRTDIEVDAKSVGGKEIKVVWPAASIAVRSLRGRLVEAGEARGKIRSLRGASVELLELRTAKPIAQTTTNTSGHYALPFVEAGLYVLRISPPVVDGNLGSDSRDMAIELGPEAAHEQTPILMIKKTECLGVQISPLEP